MAKLSKKTLPENINYKSGKDIASYNRDWTYNPDLIANEYTNFEVESYQELTIGEGRAWGSGLSYAKKDRGRWKCLTLEEITDGARSFPEVLKYGK
ncbi:hypothetical protein [Sporomusa rhizae]|uniref:hypothetical protein n=1 Tax=Sporomusa rhizae TaxID=357999 RepID=UPI00352A2984